MDITTITYTRAFPYISRANIKMQFDMGNTSINTRLKEIKEEIEKGRYSDLSIIKDGGFTFVNYLVWVDYLKNREKLKEESFRKYVEPFNPKEIAKEIGWYN